MLLGVRDGAGADASETVDGLDESRIRYTVLDANTFAILSQGDIGSAGYDYYMGSIGVNSLGQVVIGYNRSGLDPATGKVAHLRDNMVAGSGRLPDEAALRARMAAEIGGRP